MKIRIGAATIVTLLLVLLIGGYGIYQQRRSAAQPPVVERTVQGTTPHGVAPVPEFLLHHQAEIALSQEQTQRIQKIATAYRKDIRPYQQQMKTSSAAYQKSMERRQQGKRLSIEELQRAADDVQRVSSIVVTTRHAYWQQACAVLTAPQQTKVDKLVAQATLQDLQ